MFMEPRSAGRAGYLEQPKHPAKRRKSLLTAVDSLFTSCDMRDVSASNMEGMHCSQYLQHCINVNSTDFPSQI